MIAFSRSGRKFAWKRYKCGRAPFLPFKMWSSMHQAKKKLVDIFFNHNHLCRNMASLKLFMY